MALQGLYTVAEIAQRADRNPESVRRWIRAGKLRAVKVGAIYFVTQQDYANFTPPIPRGRGSTKRLNSQLKMGR